MFKFTVLLLLKIKFRKMEIIEPDFLLDARDFRSVKYIGKILHKLQLKILKTY